MTFWRKKYLPSTHLPPNTFIMSSSVRSIVPLNVVNAEKEESWKIKVKIIRLWKQTYTNNPGLVASIDMVLMDEQGNKIQATVKRNLFSQFEMLLEEGAIRVISNFGLAANTGKFLLTQHKSKINFYRTTVVRNCTEWDSDEQQFEFMSFTDILDNKIEPIYAFDVIGEVVYCEDTKVLSTKGGERRIKTVHLQDSLGVKLNCALWDNYANQLTEFLSDAKNKDTRVILLLQFAKFGEWRNEPQVSNSMFGSRMWINDDLPAITEFKDRLLAVTAEVNAFDRILSSNTVYSNPRDYWMRWEVKTIDEIADITTETGCVVVGTIISIQAEHGWYYLACQKCSKKVDRVVNAFADDLDVIPEGKFDCVECGVVTDVYGRIKVQVRVQDGTGSVSFVLFQKDVTEFIGKKATDLLSNVNQADDFELFPDDFNMFINKRFVFKIKVSDYNLKYNYRVYTVNKMSADEDIINSVLEITPMLEDIPDIPQEADVQILSIESGAVISKDAISVTGDATTPNELLKSTASSPGTKRKIEVDGVETHVMFKASSSKTRPDVSTLKIPKMEKL